MSVHRQIAVTLPIVALAVTLLASCTVGNQGIGGAGVTGQVSIADAHSTYQVGAVATAAAAQALAKKAVVGLRATALAEEAARAAAITRQTATAEALAAQVARVHAQATAAAQAILRAHAAETAAAKAQATAAARPRPTPTRPPTLKPAATARPVPASSAAPKPSASAHAPARPTAGAPVHPTAVPRAQLTQAAAALAKSKTLLKYRVALGASILQIGRVSDDLLRAAKLIHPRQPDFNPIALVKAGKSVTSARRDLVAAGKKLPGAKAPAGYLTIRDQIAAAIAAYNTAAELLDRARANTGQGKHEAAIKQVADAKAIILATDKSIAAVNSQINQLG